VRCIVRSEYAALIQAGQEYATAYQYDNREECFRLGDDFTNENAEWSLIDEQNPTKGVKLKYKNGTYCPGNSKYRSLTISFPCNNRDRATAEYDSRVVEIDCEYFINFGPTSAGCPLGCRISGDTVCGLHGFCGYDSDRDIFSCFCDQGW